MGMGMRGCRVPLLGRCARGMVFTSQRYPTHSDRVQQTLFRAGAQATALAPSTRTCSRPRYSMGALRHTGDGKVVGTVRVGIGMMHPCLRHQYC